MNKHYMLGKKGEEIASNFIMKKGGQILELNWRYQKAEIDIIFLQNKKVVFVEVKTRSSNQFGNPEEFVSERKQQLYFDAAEEFLFQNKLKFEIQFDIISIVHNKNETIIKHIEDAF